MKHLFIVLIAAVGMYSCSDNKASTADAAREDSINFEQTQKAANDTANYTSIEWIDSTSQQLGKVKEGQVVEVSWRFKNAGDKPLVIVNVMPGCGCTVAEKPVAPIAPGEESVIKGKFNSAGQSIGEHNKSMAVQANTKGTQLHNLSFRVEVTK